MNFSSSRNSKRTSMLSSICMAVKPRFHKPPFFDGRSENRQSTLRLDTQSFSDMRYVIELSAKTVEHISCFF